MRHFILAIFSLLIILPMASATAQDSTVLIKFNSFYSYPAENGQDCALTGRLSTFDAKLVFKNGRPQARWEGQATAENGKVIFFRIELVQGNGLYQMAIIAEDERAFPVLAHRMTFSPTDTLVSRGFYVNAFADLPVCRESLIVTVKSISFG